MSDLLAEGVQVVRSAEESLRDLMQTAVREGQYDRVTVLASWAELLSRIPDEVNRSSPLPNNGGQDSSTPTSPVRRVQR